MDALLLDPGGYLGTYKLVGGRPSLDFVNTVSWPGTPREHDWLSSKENLRQWLQTLALAAPRGAPDLAAARGMRAMLDAVLRPLAHGKPPSRAATAALSAAAARASAARVIDPATLDWRWTAPADIEAALAPVVLDAVELVVAGERDRLRHCPACDWLFEDRTRNGQRRWCDMADCGSRDKARRYYHRTK
ncbi:MAG TPA: ABATE domain-containing protein [Luteimonas sp.]|nr:ABATE domain-containing protein [Luteimonas sp.]